MPGSAGRAGNATVHVGLRGSLLLADTAAGHGPRASPPYPAGPRRVGRATVLPTWRVFFARAAGKKRKVFRRALARAVFRHSRRMRQNTFPFHSQLFL